MSHPAVPKRSANVTPGTAGTGPTQGWATAGALC